MQQGPPASPFTNAPLHHRSNHTPYPQSGPPGHYSGYPYNYPPSGYPSYHTPGLSQYYQQQPGHQPTTANKTPAQSSAPASAASAAPSASSTAPAVAGSSKDGADKAHTADGHDANAWEAAQHILQAINFTLHQIEDLEQPETPAVTASDAPATAPAAPSTSAPTQTAAEAPRTTLTEDERASLQAQLALLAAQLTEIANESDDEDEDMQEPTQVPSQLQPAPELPALGGAQAQPESIPEAVPPVQSEASAAPDSNQFGDLSSEAAGRAMAMLLDNLDSAAQALAAEEGEESDEDEDMEMVEVPTYVESDALRT
ncbi:hypothetical protein EVJ58_g2003 [Rhodofomes roseus]|uniref:Uncharacterized protein n=1 Tax=Rhodofomes roseus TaxID=34475 RepID=A0A4Y9YUM9_9APHY|nr:hypothetical protein EVJ58_g2003 [Rhodofomes roseus]